MRRMFTSLMVLMPEARLPAQPGRHWAMVLVISNRSDQSAASRGLDRVWADRLAASRSPWDNRRTGEVGSLRVMVSFVSTVSAGYAVHWEIVTVPSPPESSRLVK